MSSRAQRGKGCHPEPFFCHPERSEERGVIPSPSFVIPSEARDLPPLLLGMPHYVRHDIPHVIPSEARKGLSPRALLLSSRAKRGISLPSSWGCLTAFGMTRGEGGPSLRSGHLGMTRGKVPRNDKGEGDASHSLGMTYTVSPRWLLLSSRALLLSSRAQRGISSTPHEAPSRT